MHRSSRLASAILLLAAAAACNKAQARTPGPVTALEMPPPPARVLIPVVLNTPVEPDPVEPEPEPAAPPPTQPRSAPRTARPADSSEPAPPAIAEAAPQPVLQATADVAAVEGRILSFLQDAQRNLNRLRPDDLNASARAQYDMALGFIRIANERLKVKSYMYAEQLASKAATIAAQLVKS
jgi:hypothetical protein